MKLGLKKKLMLGFASILALMIITSTLTYIRSISLRNTEQRTLLVRVPTMSALTELQRDLNQTQSKGRQAILGGNQSGRWGDAKKLFDVAWNAVDDDIARLDKMAADWTLQANRERLTQTKQHLVSLRQIQETAMKHAEEAGHDGVVKAGDEFADSATPENEAIKQPMSEMSQSFSEYIKQDNDYIESETRIMDLTLFFATLVALGIGIAVASLLSRNITQASQRVLTQAEAIAGGDLTRADLQIRSQDELGNLTQAINKMSASLKNMILAITDNAHHVASASTELNATSQQISANSEETSAQAALVSDAANRVNQNLQSVSTGAEEMMTTIQSIATNAHEAAKVAGEAVQSVQAANTTVGKLGESSAEIGEVIKVITSIAQQTNLLALNATIEAARAGEAGKGFAVVANEVKELAKQTAKATEDISRKITAIQTDTKGAVEAIGNISGVINQISDLSGTIATAVEEQSATTNEMTRNVADAAKGSAEISTNIAGVADAARGTSNSAQESLKEATDLADSAAQLQKLVAQFRLPGNPSTQKTDRSMAAGAGA